MAIKKLPKKAVNRVQVYLSDDEKREFDDLKNRMSIDVDNKVFRIMLAFILESNTLKKEFLKYTYNYLNFEEIVRAKNMELTDSIEATPRDKLNSEVDKVIGVLEENGMLNPKKNHYSSFSVYVVTYKDI